MDSGQPIDLASTGVASETHALLLWKNFAASAAVAGLACVIYWVAPHNARQMGALYGSTTFSFTGAQSLVTGTLVYVALLAAYFLFGSSSGISKSLRFFRVVAAFIRAPATSWQQRLVREDRVAVLATLLKMFYAPMMWMMLVMYCMGALANGGAIIAAGMAGYGFQALFDRYGFWFLMQVILFVDVIVYTVGYLVELPRLRNQIRSVDPTLLGWAVALLCYPPFNPIARAILGAQISEFPQFDDPTVHLVLNSVLLALMAIYAAASVAMGFKGSNLTHRGVVARGPYALVRHPAYACKNLAWWIGSVPLVSAAFGHSLFDGIQSIASVAGWTMLYVLRALTEEDHLRSVDGEYAVYATKVRYRFIPGVI